MVVKLKKTLKMITKKFDHPYLKIIKSIDLHDRASRKRLIENLTFEKIKNRPFIYFIIIITFGYYYFKIYMNISQSVEEALAAHKLNTLLKLKNHADLFNHQAYKKIYSYKELNYLKRHPISHSQLLEVLYFQPKPLKYKKIWKSLFYLLQEPAHHIDFINLYYDELKSNYSISNEQIINHLKKKLAERSTCSLSIQELELAFKELVQSQQA